MGRLWKLGNLYCMKPHLTYGVSLSLDACWIFNQLILKLYLLHDERLR